MKKVVRLYYGYQFFSTLLLWVPIFYEYQRRIGLSEEQIFSIQSIYYIVFCLLEIPTGFLADRWGYRHCLRWGTVVLTVSQALPLLFPSYQGFLWHFLLLALSRSFASGASSAYLYDYLKAHGQAGLYKQAEGNARAYGLFGKVLCWGVIGYLMEWHLTLPCSLTTLASIISIGFVWMLPPFRRDEQSQEEGSIFDPRMAWRSLRSSSLLPLIMFQGVGVFVLARIGQVNLFQPILSEKSFSLSSFGIVMSVMTLFEAVGSARPGWMRRWFSDLNSVFILTALMGVSLSLIAISGTWGTCIGLCIFAWTMGISFPIQRQLLNDAIPDSRCRATLLSIESIVDRAVCAWVASLTGTYVSSGQLDLFLHLTAAATLAWITALFLAFWVFQRVRTAAPDSCSTRSNTLTLQFGSFMTRVKSLLS